MKREREKLRRNQISKLLKTRSCKDIWSLYNQMTGKAKEDREMCLNTESGDTTNDPKKCAGHNEPIMDTSMKCTTLEIRNEIYKAKNSRSSGTDKIDAIFLKHVVC